MPCVSYVTWGTQGLADLILGALEECTACLLANHGMVVVGPNLKRAAWLAVEIEALACHYWHALQVGSPHILPDAEIANVAEKFKSYGQGDDGTKRVLSCC